MNARGWLAAALVGVLLAAAPPFSGVALAVTLLCAGVLVGWAAALPRPASGTAMWGDSGWRGVWPWLVWATVFAAWEVWVLSAGDELAWPTLSAILDPALGHPVVRAVAGAAWVVAGFAVGHALRADAAVAMGRFITVAVAFCIWAVFTLTDGSWWAPRDAPLSQAPGVDNLPPDIWPATAWLTIAVFAVIAITPVMLHLSARRGAHWADLPAAFHAATGTLIGRWTAVLWWWWCGWHFLAR